MDADALAKKYGGQRVDDPDELAAQLGGKPDHKSSDAYKRGRFELPGALQGLASVAQGPTLGFADEIGGIVGGVAGMFRREPFEKGYRETRDLLRGAADSQSETNPITSMVTRGMASAPTLLLNPFGKAIQGAGTASRVGNAALTGATTGAVSGAGTSSAETMLGVASDAGLSAASGGVLSALGVPAGDALGAVSRNVGTRFSDKMAERFGREKVAEALTRDARGAVVQDSLTTPLTQAVRRFERLGPEARIVDAGGQNTRALLDTLSVLPGRAKEASEAAIRTRQAGRADRLIGSATNALGTGGQRVAGVVEDLIETRAQAATPLYGQLHQMTVKADPELSGMVKAALEVGAGTPAKKIAAANQQTLSLGQDAADNFLMRDLDHLKQGLDELIEKATDPTGKLSPTGFAYNKLRTRLLDKLDDMTDGFYKQTRDAFAGPSALIDATKKGKAFFSADDAATRKVLDNFSESEREAFRLGAFEALRNKLGRPGGQSEVMGMWKDKVLREKLQAVFPDERAFRTFAADVARESRLRGLEGVGRGSQTAARQMALGDLDVSAVQDVGGMIGGASSSNLPGFLLSASSAWNRVKTPEPVRDAMARSLLLQGDAGRRGLLAMDDIMREVNAARSGRAAATGVLGGGLLAPSLLQ